MFANIIVRPEVCPLNKSDIRAIDYVVGSALKKSSIPTLKRLYLNVGWCSTWTQLVMFSWKGYVTFSWPIGAWTVIWYVVQLLLCLQTDVLGMTLNCIYTEGCPLVQGMTLNCIHIFIVTGSFLYWYAIQRFFIHSCVYLRILIISYLATFLALIAFLCWGAVK